MSFPRELTVAVGEHESLIAQELLRQRLLPDGNLENLVRWCLTCQSKKSNSSDNESTSTSSSDDSKQSKYVFLWMSNQEVMECCPSLYCTDTTTTPPRQTDEQNDGQSDSTEASSDVEDLDDMRHDVIKLVNRARKQMHRVKNITKPFASLSHTIKVLSTYAGLGSLCSVFRETGALDLILELLWTNDVDTRRAAGRMLRALALHDAGSRAYVLLSLTQDESTDNHKQQYADFENRVMVMEMFAETASGEEAHAVALDSVQLPQVPGKALFTLMKCYLRVMSLLDMDESKNQKQNKKRCSWMLLGDDVADETVNQFEVAMAISDLIYELNRIMDWNGISKSMRVKAEKIRAGTTKADPTKKSPTNPQSSSDNSSGVNHRTPKPLFAERLQDTTLDPSLLTSLIKSDQPSTTYKQPSAFSTRRQYANYVKSVIKPGYCVRACQTYQDVSEGDEGVYRQHNESTPPVQVFWHRLNRVYWVYWHHVQITSTGESSKPNMSPPKFVVEPDSSLLWPLLSGMKSKPKQIYGFQSNLSETSPETSKQNDPTRCEWWLMLFYISKLSKPAKENIRATFVKKFPACKHMCLAKPGYEISLELMRQLLQETTEQDELGMSKSVFCKNLMDIIHKEEDAEKKEKELDEKPSTSKENGEEDAEEIKQQPVSADIPSTSSAFTPTSSSDPNPKKQEENQEDDDNKGKKQTYGSVEEYARAVEMGLRISLIQDDATEKKFGKMLLEEENYRVAERAWGMQQDGEKLSTISALLEKSEKPVKIIVLTVLHSIVSRTDIGVVDRRSEVEKMFSSVLPSSESTDPSVVTCYMALVSSCCKEQTGESRTRELDSIELALATSGHLKAAFDIIARFSADRKIVEQAVHIISTVVGAREFSSNPNSNTSYTNIIIAIISSIMVTVAGDVGPKKNLIGCFLQAIEDIMNKMAADAGKSEVPAESTNETIKVLVDACCIICTILRKDQSKSLLTERETLQRIVVTGLKAVTQMSQLRKMLMRIKGLLVSMYKSDVLDDDEDDSKDDKLLDLSEDGLIIGHFTPPSSSQNLEQEFSECLQKIKEKQQPEAKNSTSNLIRKTVLPMLQKNSPVASGFQVCVSQLKDFVTELSGLAQELNLLLLDIYWSELVSSLHGVLEQCVSGTEVVKSVLHEVSGDCIAILLTLAEMDRDFAVELCGLEAKQTITRLVEKHGTIAKATELKELVTSCERHRALHSKLLAVVLGGCISTALRCVEDARRRRKPINVPLFDQLLDNLCRGADVEMKEDKCYERLEVSTNPRQVAKLTDGNSATYWESNGSSGAHWINIHMRKGVVVRKLSVLVAQEDSSYMPSRIVVLGGTSSSDVTTQLSCVTLSSTDRDVVVLENARRYWPIVRISIRRCHQGGIDTRIHGIEVVGPKPSFWPILRRQLYIRTNLTYSVQSQTWTAEAVKNFQTSSIHFHPILDLPNKINQALRFEQGFANDFLPNPESALVLGQACRTALSAPILKALISKNDGDSLLTRLLVAYVDAANQQNSSRERRTFSSKFRRLIRLLVDLDSHEQRSSAHSSNKKPQGASNFSMWSKRVHSKSAKLNNVESSKISTADSVSSRADGVGQSDRDSSNESENDNFLTSSHVNDVCKCWSRVVQSRFREHVTQLFANIGVNVASKESLNICHQFVDEFIYLQECTRQVFGSRARFAGAFAIGVWNTFMSLNPADAMRMSVTCVHVIHSHVTNRSSFGYAFIEQLLMVLQTVAGSDFCRVFEQVYSSSLSLRLLRPREEVDFNGEQQVLVKLQPCFPERRPISMLQDLSYSNNQWKGFLNDYLERLDVANQADSPEADEMLENYQRLCGGEFRVATLRPSAWNIKPATKGALESLLTNLDKRLSCFVREFTLFERRDALQSGCGTSNPGFSLHWSFEGIATILDTSNCLDLRVNTVQMILLLHFNHAKEVTFDEWYPGFGKLDPGSLQRLIDAGVICTQNENTYTVTGAATKNTDCVSSGEEEVLALWSCQDQVERHVERRRAIIDCAIVRVMKKKQECLGDLLIEHVLKYCHDPSASNFAPEEGAKHQPFLPLAREVRARCEHLTRLGYLLRNDFSPQNVMYNPDSTQQSQKEGNSTKAEPEGSEDVNDAATDSNQANTSNNYLSAPKDGVILKESVIVEVDTTVKFSTDTRSCNKSGEEIKQKAANSPILTITDPSTTTLSVDQLFGKLKETFASVTAILAVSADISEALVIKFDWNVDKLIESYMVSPAKTLLDIGISSLNAKPSTLDEESSCPVCLNTLDVNESITPPCGHTCCKNCWKTYLELQLHQDTSANTTCPVSDCTARAVTSIFRTALDGDKAQLHKHEIALVRSYVQSDRSLSWCHNPKGCDHILRNNADGCDSGWCSSCGWQTCFTCTYVEAHYPASCGHMSQWVDDGGYYEGMNEDAQSKHLARLIAKRCPNCQANIEKNDGCLHMKCAKCGYDFCWRCLQSWRPSHRDYYNCSSKVSKLAHSGQKFVEYSKRCQYHNQAKQFAYRVHERIMAARVATVPLPHVQFAVALCIKLAQCRKVLAYCNVFSYYSADTERMNAIGLHSSALENKTLALQALMSDVLLKSADIQFALGAISEQIIFEGRRVMAECDVMLDNILVFSKQDMKVAASTKTSFNTSAADGGLALESDGKEQERDLSMVYNSRPAGMSDDDESSDEHSYSYSSGTSDNVMSMPSTDDEDDDEEEDDEDEEGNLLFSTDEERDLLW